MLQSLHLRNFQTHRDFFLELDPLTTVITGPSDSGKSSLLRALRWVCTNQPRGDSFITWGEESCSVTLKVDNHTITRTRGKDNTYQLDSGEPYKSFRDDVPQAIQALLNVDPDLNFQQQLDPAFWFLKTPGEVSRELNKIVHLDRIDAVLNNLQSELRKARLTATVSEERLEKATKQAEELAWIEECHAEYQKIEAIQQEHTARSHRIDSLGGLIRETTHLASRVEALQEASQEAETLCFLYGELETLTRNEGTLSSIIEEAERLCQTIETTTSERERLRTEITRAIGETCPLCGAEQPLPC